MQPEQVTLHVHGEGSLSHAYVEGRCGDHCNNLACAAGHPHDRCEPGCGTGLTEAGVPGV